MSFAVPCLKIIVIDAYHISGSFSSATKVPSRLSHLQRAVSFLTTKSAVVTVPFRPRVQSRITNSSELNTWGVSSRVTRSRAAVNTSQGQFLHNISLFSPIWLKKWTVLVPVTIKFRLWTLSPSVHERHASHPVNTWSKWYSSYDTQLTLLEARNYSDMSGPQVNPSYPRRGTSCHLCLQKSILVKSRAALSACGPMLSDQSSHVNIDLSVGSNPK